MDEVAKRCAQGKKDSRRFLMVCQDVYDYYRGDADFGYYYSFCDYEAAVRERLSGLAFGPEWGERGEDRCHAIIDLEGYDAFDERLCVHPSHWLRSLESPQK